MELNASGIPRDVIVVGASAGGFDPTFRLLAAIPHDIPVVLAIVIHRSPFGGPSRLAEVLEHHVHRAVVEPVEAVNVAPDVVYLAPRDLHLVLEDGRACGVRSAKQHFTRPAVDPLFMSAADSYGPRVLGVLLSGAGGDGVLGLVRIKANGGMSLVQSPAEACHPSMPETALRKDHVDAALPIDELMQVVPALARGKTVRADGQPSPDRPWVGLRDPFRTL